MVDEHPCGGADGVGEPTQGEFGQTVREDVMACPAEQVFSGAGVLRTSHEASVTCNTCFVNVEPTRLRLEQMNLPVEEPDFGPWTVVSVPVLLDAWQARFPPSGTRPAVIAVDGRGASGKSTTASVLQRAVPDSVVIHTDDIAWHHAFFDWAALLRDGILVPVHAGRAVRYRPPAWEQRQREGAIVVPSGCPLIIVEGCGAARRDLTPWLDVVIWVQTDTERARTRGLIRDGGTAEVEAFWDEWMAEELPFFAADRPWERADTVVSGLPAADHDRESQLVVSTRSSP